MAAGRAEALHILPSPVFTTNAARLAELALRYRLPASYGFRQFADAGGLMSFDASVADAFRRAAVFVDKILRGANPADLPVERLGKFNLVVNLKTAQALGLTIPQSFLIQATEAIQ